MHFDNKVVVRTDIPTQRVASYSIACGQTAGWMKTPLGTEIDLRPGHIVLDGPQRSAKGAQHPLPLLGPYLLWPRSPISATAELLFLDSDSSILRKIRVFSERELRFALAICICCRLCVSLSVVCRLSVTLVHSTQAVEIFGNISTAFDSLAIR